LHISIYYKSYIDELTTDRLSRNVGKKLLLLV